VKPWLVVEDDDDIRNYVKVLFMTWGHAALEFRDGKQTFAWLDAVEGGSHDGELPELALMDIRMPGPRGNEIARRMRSIEHFHRIPIVLMTAFSLSSDERQTMLARDGVDTIIGKPLPDLLELKAMLDRLTEDKQSGNGAAPPPPSEPTPASSSHPAATEPPLLTEG
jgi:CheY-like chemotaxis protein